METLQPIGSSWAKSSPPSVLNWWFLQPFRAIWRNCLRDSSWGLISHSTHVLCLSTMGVFRKERMSVVKDFHLGITFLSYSISLLHHPTSLPLIPRNLYCPWRGVVWSFNPSTSSLCLWINVNHAENCQRQEAHFRTRKKPCLCWFLPSGRNMRVCILTCLILVHGLKLQRHRGRLLYFTW